MKPLPKEQIEPMLERVASRLAAWGAQKVILHGSLARGDHRGTSDLDLVIVKQTADRLLVRIEQVLDLCEEAGVPLPVEPLVYTPDEYDEMLAAGNPLLTRAIRQGRVLYEQPRA